MKINKILLLIGLSIFIAVLSVSSGCGFRRNQPKTRNPLSIKNPNELHKAKIEKFITVKNLNKCVKSFHCDWKYDTQVISAFENIVVYAIGNGKVAHPPTGLVYENHLVIYDTQRNRVVKIIDADPGFVQFWDTDVNENWIVWDEVDREFDQTVKGYAMNRKTGKIKLVFSINKNDNESSFWFGAKGKDEIKNLAFNLNEIILTGNKVYVGYNIDVKKPSSVFSSRIVSIDLNDLSRSLLVNMKKSNAGLSHFSVNKNYIAFSIFGNDTRKMFSDIYVYSLKTKKVAKFTDNNLSYAPLLTPNDYIVFVLKSKDSMEMPPKWYGDTEYLVIAPVNNPNNTEVITKSSKSDQIRISTSGRFVLLNDYENGWFVYDRKKHYLLLLKGNSLPVRPSFASDNIIAGLHQEDGGFSLVNLKLLYKMLNLED